MKIEKIMTRPAGFCRTDEDLGRAVEIMWEKDCGMVPVVDEEAKVVGTVTDRDAAVSVFLRNEPPAAIKAGEVIGGGVVTCAAKDDVDKALKLMKKHQIKRLPVVDKKGKLEGIISVTDILLASKGEKSLRKKVLKTLAAIHRPRAIVLTAIEE
jgi:CBS domain-containing protein